MPLGWMPLGWMPLGWMPLGSAPSRLRSVHHRAGRRLLCAASRMQTPELLGYTRLTRAASWMPPGWMPLGSAPSLPWYAPPNSMPPALRHQLDAEPEAVAMRTAGPRRRLDAVPDAAPW